MALINIDDLAPDMEVEQNVMSPTGMILVPAGVVLDDKKIRLLKSWGVTEAHIKGVSAEEAAAKALEEVDPQVLLKEKQELVKLFRRNDFKNPFIKELFQQSLRRRLTKRAGEQDG
ncbi:MAG: hypothetical protein EP312_00060 [Gammaproteobacteria bacterium]|nr:MAG: hypothetical protein EP312_00060 [Gammaproteobacteria bacterium]